MTRKTIDCRAIPSENGCTLTISGEPDDVVGAAAAHAVQNHSHTDSPELREMLRGALADETVSQGGAFVQLIAFDTDRIGEFDTVQDRWTAAIGAERGARWAILGADRDRPDSYLAIVEFPSHALAMANSDHPATATFLEELQAISTGKPEFRNLDVRQARPS